MGDKREQGFSKKINTALTKYVKAAEEPEKYGLPPHKTPENKQAVMHVLKLMFKFDGDTVIGFDEQFIKTCHNLTEQPTIELF